MFWFVMAIWVCALLFAPAIAIIAGLRRPD
jgi:hypothetical protein